jgi:hypothetical protein
MKEPKTCIRITGTRTGKLRARVEPAGEDRFEVTIGGEKWKTLDPQLRMDILHRACSYHYALKLELLAAVKAEEQLYPCIRCPHYGAEQQRKFCEDCHRDDEAVEARRIALIEIAMERMRRENKPTEEYND